MELEKLNLFFDGSCTKNPGGIAGFAWVLTKPCGTEYLSQYGEVCRGETATNNVAEWSGLLRGLKYLDENEFVGHLNIFGDSQLVINQINGEYKVNEKLRAFYLECSALLSKWTWTATWIPRAENERCDSLSKLGTKVNEV